MMRANFISGCDGHYILREDGQVFSFFRNKKTGRVTRSYRIVMSLDYKGYKVFKVWVNGKKEHRFLHRALAQMFIPNPNKHPHINHIDGDKLNNSLNNLEWCTPSQNVRHAFRIGLVSHQGARHNRSKLSEEDVKFIRANKGKLKVATLASIFGVATNTIYSVHSRVSWNYPHLLIK